MNTDHIHPRSKGGKDHKTNYTPSCVSCNSWKSSKSVKKFIDEILQGKHDERIKIWVMKTKAIDLDLI